MLTMNGNSSAQERHDNLWIWNNVCVKDKLGDSKRIEHAWPKLEIVGDRINRARKRHEEEFVELELWTNQRVY